MEYIAIINYQYNNRYLYNQYLTNILPICCHLPIYYQYIAIINYQNIRWIFLAIKMEIHFLAINIDPENHQFLMETSLPTPMTARVFVNLPEGTH